MTIVAASGDITGATDVAAINAALLTDDVQLVAGAQYYVQPDASGAAIYMPNNRTLQGESASNKSRILMTNTLSATLTGSMITGTGSGLAKNNTIKNLYLDGGRARARYSPTSAIISFTSGTNTITDSSNSWLYFGFSAGMNIIVGGTASNNGTYTIASVSAGSIVVNEALVTEAATTGAYIRQSESQHNNILAGSCISFASQSNYGSNALAVTDVEMVNGPIQNISCNSVDGLTMTRVTSSADRMPVQSGHGNDFDAVSADKPSKNISWVDSDIDAYGNEAVKYENSEDVSHTGCTFRTYCTLVQDPGDPYSDLKNISFTNCTFYSYVSMAYLKRQHIPGRDMTLYNPTMGLTLSSAGVSSGETAGVTITAASGTPFATSIFGGLGPVGTMITATESGRTGAALITGRTSDTVVTATIINPFGDTSVAANTWRLAQTNNSGTGNVTFTSCTFSGDDASLRGSDNCGVNYGAVTVTGCTFTGRNSHLFPTAYSGFRPTFTNCTGISNVPSLWLLNESELNPKIVNIIGSSGMFPSTVKSLGNTSAALAMTNIASAIYDGYDFTNARITFKNGTYTRTSGFITGFTNGNVNIPLSIEGEDYGGVIIDGSATNNAFFSYTGTNNKLVTVKKFYVTNFVGASARFITVNAATAVARITGNYIYSISTSSTGGCGVRVQACASCVIDNNECYNLSSTTSGSGLAFLIGEVNCVVASNYIHDCAATGTTSGMIFLQANATAGTNWCFGNVIVRCSATSVPGIGVSTAVANTTFNIYNNAMYDNTATTSPVEVSMFLNNASVTVNFFNNIVYSSLASSVGKTTNGIFNHGDNCTKVAISATGGTNNDLGGNILTDPAFTDTSFLTIGSTSPCFQTGVLLSSPLQTMIRDRNGRPFSIPSSMGAYEMRTSGYPGSSRTIGSARTLATNRTLATTRSLGTQKPS